MMRSPLLFRQHNPLAAQLAASTCVFKLHAAPSIPPEVLAPDILREKCARLGATLKLEREAIATTLVLSVPHSALDAFGGMWLLARYSSVPAPGALVARRHGTANHCRYV